MRWIRDRAPLILVVAGAVLVIWVVPMLARAAGFAGPAYTGITTLALGAFVAAAIVGVWIAAGPYRNQVLAERAAGHVAFIVEVDDQWIDLGPRRRLVRSTFAVFVASPTGVTITMGPRNLLDVDWSSVGEVTHLVGSSLSIRAAGAWRTVEVCDGHMGVRLPGFRIKRIVSDLTKLRRVSAGVQPSPPHPS